jgi:biotin operon repressor
VSVLGHHPSPRNAAAAFLAAPNEQLAAEAEHAARHARVDGRLLTGFTGTETDRVQFLRALHGYARRLVGGQWGSIEAFLTADLRSRTAPLASAGLGAVLRSLHPSVRWDSETATLLVEDGTDRDIKLAGRGLLVVPKFFASRVAVHVPLASEASVILAYPAVQPGQDHLPRIEPLGEGLAAVLGVTRAKMLKEISEGTTAQQDLAAATGTTGAAIGQHAAKLRGAGLIATVRRDGRAFHVLTAAGDAIVANAGAGADGSPTRDGSGAAEADPP